MFVMSCADCVAGFACCVIVLVGEEGSHSSGMWLCGIACLWDGWLFGWLAMRVLWVVLVAVRLCIRLGGFHRLPALKISFFAI